MLAIQEFHYVVGKDRVFIEIGEDRFGDWRMWLSGQTISRMEFFQTLAAAVASSRRWFSEAFPFHACNHVCVRWDKAPVLLPREDKRLMAAKLRLVNRGTAQEQLFPDPRRLFPVRAVSAGRP